MKNLYLSILIGCGIAPCVFSQSIERSVIGSAGAFSSAGSVQLSWTVGETIVNTVSSGSVMLTQGFQQPELPPSAVKSINRTNSILVYPNPSSGIFQLSNKDVSNPNAVITAVVSNNAGQLVKMYTNIDLNAGSFTLDLSQLSGGIYTLNLQIGDSESAAYKLTIIR